ncbi:hypothetical protein Tco_0312912 [Tanacetum coccineum]
MLSLYITAKVAGKPVSISEASIRSDLLFDDADGIDSLPNQAIFDVIQLMGYEGINLMNVLVPLDHFPVNTLTSKVFSFMVKKGKHFSGKVTPLFSNMLVQPTEDKGEQTERPSEPHLTPSHPHPSEVHVEPQSDPSSRPSPTTHILDSIPENSGGNHGGQSSSIKSLLGNEGDMTLQSVYDLCISLCTQVTDQAKEIKHLKAQIKKLKKKAKPVITHHRAWMKSVSLKQRLAGKKSLKKKWMQKESVSKQGRKSAKDEPSVHKDPLFDELADDTLDYMDTENAQDVGDTRMLCMKRREFEDANEADRLLALRLQEEEVRRFNCGCRRTKLLHDTNCNTKEGAKDLEHKDERRRLLKKLQRKKTQQRLDKVSSPDGDFLGFTESMGNSGHSTILWRRIAKDVKDYDQDLTKCLDTSSKNLRRINQRNMKLNKFKTLCLGEDCWELCIPNLVPLGLGSQNGKEQTYQESSKKQRLEEDKESDEVEEVEEDDEDALKKYLVIKKDDDIAIDVIPLATKLPVIVDYKLHKEGLMAHYELIRADGTSRRYTSMIRLLQETDIDKGRNQAKNRHVEHGMEKRL